MCSFYKVDLHIHSPHSDDYRGDKNTTPYSFVSDFISRGFDLIAITDHNSGSYIDEAIEARNRIAREEGKNISILPGVELNVTPGIHLLAVFSENGSEFIKDFLSRLGMTIEQQGKASALVSLSIDEISQTVRDRGGLLIGAHCNSSKGVINELRGQTRRDWLCRLDALDINSGSDKKIAEKTIAYVHRDLGVRIPFIFGSDSHDSSCVNSGMWVKMAEPTFLCLRQLVFEPELRISRTDPRAPQHSRIVGFTTTHGIYAHERFRFSPHLNTLVGGRGAGKSAAIDLVRFAFEADVRSGGDSQKIFDNRIGGFLQSAGKVLVVVVGVDQNTYLISRSGEFEKPNPRAGLTFTAPPEVFQIVSGEILPRNLHPQQVLGIEFFGQGEVALLADRVNEQLRLIDENLDHSESLKAIERVQHELNENEIDHLELTEELEDLRVQAAKKPELEKRLEILEGSLADQIFEERSNWDNELVWINKQINWINRALARFPESIVSPSASPQDITESNAKHVSESIRRLIAQTARASQVDLLRLRRRIIQAKATLDSLKRQWDSAFEIAKEEYNLRLVELGAANLTEIASEHRAVGRRLKDINERILPRVTEIEANLRSLSTERTTLLSELGSARSRIAQSRSEYVSELNSMLGGDVRVDLSGTDSAKFFDAIEEPLQGTGMRHRESQVSRVCDQLDPTTFVEIIRNRSLSSLIEIGITEFNAQKMIDHLNEKHLFRIEQVDIPQSPKIRVKREGDESYTNLTDLSVGEKCSAILSIALLGKGKPLVIDQPEDDLDHAFIINSIVQGIRAVKPDRQVIAATHNPNIPVLGDAEMVFRVARNPGEEVCAIQCSGGLELPHVTLAVQSLEGGVEAFERRRQKYSVVS